MRLPYAASALTFYCTLIVTALYTSPGLSLFDKLTYSAPSISLPKAA